MQDQTKADFEVFKEEREWIGGGTDEDIPSRRFSLALSGCGVRAAAVARGLLDEFIRRSMIGRLDYLS